MIEILQIERDDGPGKQPRLGRKKSNARKRLSLYAVMHNPDEYTPENIDQMLITFAQRYMDSDDVDVVALFVWQHHRQAMMFAYDFARVQIAKDDDAWDGQGNWLGGTYLDKARGKRLVVEYR